MFVEVFFSNDLHAMMAKLGITVERKASASSRG